MDRLGGYLCSTVPNIFLCLTAPHSTLGYCDQWHKKHENDFIEDVLFYHKKKKTKKKKTKNQKKPQKNKTKHEEIEAYTMLSLQPNE